MSVAQPRPAPNPVRRQRLLEAGERLFSSIGYRAVTMARIAEEAGFAKATVYAYFADKDDVFRSVAGDVAERLVSAVADGLDGTGSLSARVTAALSAKDVIIYDLVAGSAHAAELFEAKDRLVRAVFDDTDRRILALVTAAMASDPQQRLESARLARITVRASRGLATRAENRATLVADIDILIGRLLNG
jgi:AcrR family transcriptional regulator